MKEIGDLIQSIVIKTVAELRNYNTEYTIKPSFGVYKIDNPYLDVELMHDRAVLASKGVKSNFHVNLHQISSDYFVHFI